MDNLDYSRILTATLRNAPQRQPGYVQPDPMAGSVMSQPAEPPPEINQDLPLEPVSPEDWVPNPKSLVAALKGGAGMLGAVGSMKWPKEIIEALKIRKLDTPSYNSWDANKEFPMPYELTLPVGRGRAEPNTVFAGESTVDAHIKRYLSDVKDAKKKVTPPSENVLNLINSAGKLHYGGEYLPYGGRATVNYQEIPISKFMKKFPAGKENNSYNYGIGIQGIAHGVSPDGKFMPLLSSKELTPGSYVAGRTDDAADQTIWKLLEDR